MIWGGFKRIGDSDGDFWYKINDEKVHVICCRSDVSNFARKQQKDYAGHVVRMTNDLWETTMFNDEKYHRIGRKARSILEQVLKFSNSTIDNFINNSMKCWPENSTLYIYIYIYIYIYLCMASVFNVWKSQPTKWARMLFM